MNNLINESNQTPIEIALQIDGNGMTTARKLYEFLELAKGQFSRWCKTNILENTFAEEGADYIGFDINVEGNNVKDFKLKAGFAKNFP
jgi:anti-repressor protein